MLLKITFILFAQMCTTLLSAEVPQEYLLETKTLPEDRNFMPSLSNGHLGYTVFGDSIFMVGVYNGAGGESKRARMPNWLNISATICDRFECMSDADISTEGSTYEMNLKDGYFRYRQTYPKIGVTLEQRTYPHRYYTRALVYEVVATRSGMIDPEAAGARSTRMNSPLYLKLEQHPGADSDAFTFVVINNGSAADPHRVLRGRTEVVEFERFQNASREIYAVFSENFEQEVRFDWPTWQPVLRYKVIVSIDTTESVARKEMEDVQKLSPEELLKSHTDAWHDFWENNFAVEIEGDLELWRIINAGVFYLACSLPSLASNQPNLPFYGLSPTGLARGNLEADYQGHSFWDTEIWMLPVISQFSYTWAKEILEYRYRLLSGAQYNAYAKGYKGARFPWESAYTGTEVTNNCCPEIAQQEIHISPDIAFALHKYYSMSHDLDFHCAIAWPMVHEIADFIVSRAACWELFKVCHLLDVMGPDEDHEHVDDNVYTNAVSKIALEFAVFTGEMCGNESHTEKIQNWQSIADQLLILYDEKDDYHPQHLGYTKDTVVKQADTILLGYPLQFGMNRSTRLNDLETYSKVTRESGPAMTWSMFALNYLQADEDEHSHEYFERGYKSYVRPEFKVWSETPIGHSGSANFLTGIGGFLQAIITGYGGIDYGRNGQQSVFQTGITNLPPNVTQIIIKSIRFGGSSCKLTFNKLSSSMDCSGAIRKFEVTRGKKRMLYENTFSVFRQGNETLTIKAL